MHYQHTIEIDARPEDVWNVLTDVERWPEWTRSMTNVERLDPCPLRAGSSTRIKQPRFSEMTWRVTAYTPGTSFAWETHSPGIHSVASHTVMPNGHGGSTVTLSVQQTGPVAILLAPFLRGVTRRYVKMEADGLKQRCEGRTAAQPSLVPVSAGW